MSSDSSSEGDIDEKFERENKVSGIKDGKIYVPEGEVMVSEYGSGQRGKFG